jgi:copper(I)-binding protein
MSRGVGVFLVVIGLVGAAAGDTAIRIEDPWVRRAPALPGSESRTAAYLTIWNQGEIWDVLLSASADVAASIELHETRNMAGMMMMEPVSKIILPPGERVALQPGGYHLMLIGLGRALAPGETVTFTLRFERAGPVTVQARVR